MAIKKRPHPKFLRPNFGRTSRSRIKAPWRRQRGIDNKKRAKIAYMGASPSIGYGQPSAIKHFHPRGMPEKIVQSPADLTGLKGVLVRIAGSVGRKKRAVIEKLAKEAKLHVLNPMHERKADIARKEGKAARIAAIAKKKGDDQKKIDDAKKAAEAKKADEQKKEEAKKAAAAPAAKPAAPAEQKKQ